MALNPEEGIRRIRNPGDLGGCSFSTKSYLGDLATSYEQLKLKFEASELALRGFQVCHEMLQKLPELNMANYVESEVQTLNDGVCSVCCEMETTREEYDKSLDQIEARLQQDGITQEPR